MKQIIQHPVFGTIEYDENFWTGKKNLAINGVALIPRDKKSFWLFDGTNNVPVYVKGNFLSSASLLIGTETVQLTPAPKWYEYVLAILPFVLIMIWGNSRALCEIVPVVGGVIGGAISGGLGALSLMTMKGRKDVFAKLLVGVGFAIAVFAVCALIGIMLVGALS